MGVSSAHKEFDRPGRQALLLAYCLVISAVLLGLCSRSSPLYPLNDWVDTNCFFTVGKAMFNGRVVYRDIYEQKGVLLYFLYGLAWLFSHTSFLGVYVLEVLCMALFLYLTCRTAALLVSPRAYCLVLPGLAAVLCSSYAFYLGGSVEQLGLALLYLPLHCMIRTYVTGGGYLPARGWVIALGAAAGCLLWMKFTLLGVYIGYVLFVIVVQLDRRDPAGLLRAAGCFLLGLLAASLPWLLYFGLHHALRDAFVSYFYNNIALYPQLEGSRLSFVLENLRHGLFWNARMALLIALGVLAVLLSRSSRPLKLGLFSLYFCTVLFLYIGGAAYDYYAFGMAALTVPGAMAAAWLLQRGWQLPWKGRSAPAFRPAVSAALCLLLLLGGGLFARRHSVNSFYTAYDRQDMWYSDFARIIEQSEDRSLLNYGFLDLGEYTVTGYVPQSKFFCVLNLDLPEMRQEIEDSVRDRKTMFIVTIAYEDDPLLTENYELVKRIDSFYEFEEVPMSYYLLQRRE